MARNVSSECGDGGYSSAPESADNDAVVGEGAKTQFDFDEESEDDARGGIYPTGIVGKTFLAMGKTMGMTRRGGKGGARKSPRALGATREYVGGEESTGGVGEHSLRGKRIPSRDTFDDYDVCHMYDEMDDDNVVGVFPVFMKGRAGSPIFGKSVSEVQQALRENQQIFIEKNTRKFRKIVTGDEETRVRDYFTKYAQIPKVLRTVDKLSFTCGVIGLCVTEGIALQVPCIMWVWFITLMAWLVGLRTYMYFKEHLQYFLIDFCYFSCTLVAFTILFASNSVTAFHSAFACASGPVLFSLIVWRNSLVFHSVDKITTVYLHVVPALMMWCWRWYGMQSIEEFLHAYIHDFGKAKGEYGPPITKWDAIGRPFLIYCFWQFLYLLKTEWIDRDKLNSNPELQTSLRWIAHDPRMGAHKMSLILLRKVGLMGKEEEFDPHSFKTKMVMVTGQILYTLLTLTPVTFMYRSYAFHSFVMIGALCVCVWNGASYYIEVFSQVYAKSRFSDKISRDAKAD